MTILRIKIAVLLLLCSLAGARAQVRPDQFPLQTNIQGTNFEIYSQYNGVNTKTLPIYMKEYFVPNVDSAWQAFTFTDSIGIADSLRTMFIKDNRGRVFYVDADGDALLLKDTAQAVGNVYALATLADTSTVASPVEGDIAVVGSDTLLFYETYWLMFAGGAGGIYGGSGTVPASTWVEQLGSLIFDIDSLGSFTFGDIDEKSTGAYISVSNSAGNAGQVTIKSGSGAGYTDATVQINNYELPGKKPNSYTLPDGDYMWIVSQSGIRKGEDSTGWIHIDSLLAGRPTGSGTLGTLPIWTGTETLGNSSLTESAEEAVWDLTGSLTVPSGTDAEVPVWANGKLRYNTTTGGFQGGANGYYLPWASGDNFTGNHIPYSDGSRLISSANLTFSGSNLSLLASGSDILMTTTSQVNFGSVNRIESTSAGNILINGNASLKLLTGGKEGIVVDGRYGLTYGVGVHSIYAANPLDTLFITQTGKEYEGVETTVAPLVIMGGTARQSASGGPFNGGKVVIMQGLADLDTLPTMGNWGPVEITTIKQDGTGRQAGLSIEKEYTFNNILPTTSGIKTATFESGNNLRYRIENLGDISTSTDASGDIVVAHGMGVTPTSVQVTTTGTADYSTTVHTIGSTNFTVRFRDRMPAYGEIYIDDFDPDTVTFLAGSTTPLQSTGWTTGDLLDFTYSGGRLTYTGADTARFFITYGISFSFSENSQVIEGWIYQNGTAVEKSEIHRKIGTAGDVGNAGSNCFIRLAPNDYIEVFFAPQAHVGDDNIIIENANVSVHKILGEVLKNKAVTAIWHGKT